MRPRLAIRVASVVTLALPAALHAQWGTSQQSILTGRPIPWRWAWSPLQSIADLPRTFDLPTGSRVGARPEDVAAPIGLFWTASNPGALPGDLAAVARRTTSSRVEFTASGGTRDGAYRRPLDPMETRDASLDVFGWTAPAPTDTTRRARRGVAAIGRFSVDQQRFDPSAIAMQAEPFGSNPFVPVDTTTPQVRSSRAQLDGAIARRFGRVGAGIALAYATRDAAAEDTRFARLGRQASPAVGAGVALPFRSLGREFSVGAQGRILRDVETITMVSRGGGGVVYPLEGYGEVDAFQVASSPYRRRMERSGRSFGINVATTVAGVSFVAHGAAESRDERQSSQSVADPPSDTWDARGFLGGVAVAGGALQGRAAIVLDVTTRLVDGEARRADLDGIVFRGEERGSTARGEGTFVSRSGAWQVRVAGQFDASSRRRDDLLYRRGTDIVGRGGAGSADLSLRVSSAVGVHVGGSVGSYVPTWTVFALSADSAVQRTILGPSLAAEVTPATVHGVRGGVSWDRGTTRLWALGVVTGVAAGESRLRSTYGLGGERRTARLLLGMDVRR